MSTKEKNQQAIPILFGLVLLCTATIINAHERNPVTAEPLNQEILNLKHKIERLEKSRIPLNRKEKQAEKPEEAKPSTSWLDRIHLNGLIEVEASYSDTPRGSTSNLAVSTMELGVDTQISPWFNAHLLILDEEAATEPPLIDEGILTIANAEQSPWSIAAGLMYVPFGNYDSNMVSDPLTLEIGETRETAVQGGYMSDDFHALVYLFNGDIKHSGNDRLDSFGFNLGLSHEATGANLGYTMEVSWLNDLADSNNLQDAIANPDKPGKRVAGLGFQASVIWKSWKLIGEYLGAQQTFDRDSLEFRGRGARPKASNIEASYTFHFLGAEANAGIGWQRSREALALTLPENRYLATIAIDIFTDTTLSLEYTCNQNYAKSQGGTGENSNGLTLQLAASF
ncbi:MAG TPA: LbtU family siderophore porin [Gammaproteobacteria bacterium]|nr:LbtU family siderophore porin [Gammaproteobacteria bacterium]